MLRCAASFVTAAYDQVCLVPQDLRALPAELFTQPSFSAHFSTYYEFVKKGMLKGMRRQRPGTTKSSEIDLDRGDKS
jgi:hypothetical protein